MDSNQEMLVFCGNVVDSNEDMTLRIEERILGVKEGKIIFREKADQLNNVIYDYDINKQDIRYLSPREFLMPGFIDIHLHAPQFRFLGTHLDLTLLEWLKSYTLPTEAKFSDLSIAKDVYSKVIRQTLRSGTTSAVYFATIHLESSLLLCDLAEQYHQRAYVGKVTMNQTDLNDVVCEKTEHALRDAEEFIKRVLSKQNPLITPVVTPRFAPSCTADVLKQLGELAKIYDIPIQSHLAEMKEELEIVKKYYPQFRNYTEIYDTFNLLNDKTVMAHGVHLNDDELTLLKNRRTGIAHCPNSNISIRSGLCDVKRLHSFGINVGLGTDIAAGYSTSMLDAMRQAIATSKILSLDRPGYRHVTCSEAIYLATRGGSNILQLDKSIGTLDVGKQFDALLINTDIGRSPVTIFDGDSIQEILEKFIFQGDDRNIIEVYVAGHLIE